MKFYLASLAHSKKMLRWVHNTYPDLGVLVSYENPRKFFDPTKRVIAEGYTDIMLDSGAFSAQMKGTDVDLDAYADYVKRFQDDITIAVSVDVIWEGEKSLANWDYLCDKGCYTMPVYHFGEDEKILAEYVRRAEWVGVGGVASKGNSQRLSWQTLFPHFDWLFTKYPEHKFHAFGINMPELINRFPFYSCDAVTWRIGSRFGRLITPTKRWDISINRNKAANDEKLEAYGVWKWLEDNYGLKKSEVLSEGFDWKEIDKVNISELRNMFVLGEVSKVSSTVSMF